MLPSKQVLKQRRDNKPVKPAQQVHYLLTFVSPGMTDVTFVVRNVSTSLAESIEEGLKSPKRAMQLYAYVLKASRQIPNRVHPIGEPNDLVGLTSIRVLHLQRQVVTL